MKRKSIVPRELAIRDVEGAIDHYLAEASAKVALGFVDALEQAYDHISRYPLTGSPRYAHELNLPHLRSWPLQRFPYTVFYVERAENIDVWRVLYSKRDIPEWLHAGDFEND